MDPSKPSAPLKRAGDKKTLDSGDASLPSKDLGAKKNLRLPEGMRPEDTLDSEGGPLKFPAKGPSKFQSLHAPLSLVNSLAIGIFAESLKQKIEQEIISKHVEENVPEKFTTETN